MNLSQTVQLFLDRMNADETLSCWIKKAAGIPFLYVQVNSAGSLAYIKLKIEKESRYAMKGKRLTFECIFVREDTKLYVFRHRFYVPQEKMFCCGNLCEDCIRLKKGT
ncbi:hypothetical protein RFW18_05710 [Metabacillus idriensis]|uniref:hypothetical protein n=1 Tax=Metabacillus idriensis TaxID=324768 RepID=UPI002814331C|nr:hypothetical protein [Metabacillus idriensis]MDR0137236.1 hypothetical protein [Metabacillus idriensis]